jgi:hypothetical protein
MKENNKIEQLSFLLKEMETSFPLDPENPGWGGRLTPREIKILEWYNIHIRELKKIIRKLEG